MVKKRIVILTMIVLLSLLAGVLFMLLVSQRAEQKEGTYKGARLVMENMEDMLWDVKGNGI